MAVSTNGRKISRGDLEAAFARALGEGEATARGAGPQAALIGGAVAFGVLVLVYLAGRRRGRNRSAILEVRRL